MTVPKNSLLGCLTALLLVGLAWQNSVFAQNSFVAPNKSTNAALLYWQAFSFLPKMDQQQQAAIYALKNCDQINDNVAKLVDPDGEYFGFVELIKPSTPCDWQLPNRGMATLLPHLAKARVLAKLLVIDGCAQKKISNMEAASNRFAQAILLARNIDDGPLVCMLVGHRIEQSVADAIGDKPDGKLAAAMSQKIADLPARATLESSLKFEESLMVNWLKSAVANQNNDAKNELIQFFPSQKSLQSLLKNGSAAERVKKVEEVDALYNQLATIAAAPQEDIDKKLSAWQSKVAETKNPLATGILPSRAVFDRYYDSNAKWRAFLDRLNAAGKN